MDLRFWQRKIVLLSYTGGKWSFWIGAAQVRMEFVEKAEAHTGYQDCRLLSRRAGRKDGPAKELPDSLCLVDCKFPLFLTLRTESPWGLGAELWVRQCS